MIDEVCGIQDDHENVIGQEKENVENSLVFPETENLESSKTGETVLEDLQTSEYDLNIIGAEITIGEEEINEDQVPLEIVNDGIIEQVKIFTKNTCHI